MEYRGKVADEFAAFVSDAATTEHTIGYPAVVRELPLPSARVLDFGCGEGHFMRTLQRLGYEVVGVDQSPDMIAKAGLGALLIGESLADLGEATFAAVVANYVFCTMDSLGKVAHWIQEIAKVLQPGGSLIIFHSNYLEINEVQFSSFHTSFIDPPESGARVKTTLGQGLVVDDWYWSEGDFVEVFALAGLTLEKVSRLYGDEGTSKGVAPFLLFHVKKIE